MPLLATSRLQLKELNASMQPCNSTNHKGPSILSVARKKAGQEMRRWHTSKYDDECCWWGASTQTRLHTEAFRHRSFYTEKSLYRLAFTRRSFYTERNLYTEELLRTKAFTQRSLYTKEILHTNAFTERSFYTQKLLHREVITQRAFTHRRVCT